jgi:hypothetical protein
MLTVQVSNAGNGGVKINGIIPDNFPVVQPFASGETVNVVAVPAFGYEFSSWNGDLTGEVNPATIWMTCNKTVTANFTRVKHDLLININGSGYTNLPAGSYRYDEDEVSSLVATPNNGWYFDRWDGDVLSPTLPTTSVKLNESKVVTANFKRIIHDLAISVNGSGSTDPPIGNHSYAEGETVSIVATPASGWYFDRWDGDVLSPTSLTTSMKLNESKTVTANFKRIMHDLVISVNGSGSTDPPIGNHSYAEGETVSIAATPASGWRFEKWIGEVTNPEFSVISINLNHSSSITASFVRVFPIWLLVVITIIVLASIGVTGFFLRHRHSRGS